MDAPMSSIVIVDYGMANLRSVQKGFEKVGASAEISGDPARIASAAKLVLPGVGAFRDAIARLNEAGLSGPIRSHVQSGKPFFGICLGMQLLFTRGYEEGVHEGLNLFPGDVVRFDNVPGLKVPHMGWNGLSVKTPAPQLAGLDGQSVYFVHSYHVRPADPTLTAATADYPTPFTAAIWKDNVFASQFHPEKSQRVGLSMLEKFAKI
jgi:imidazole glycerol-phosphate synthase subunit HisH